MTCSPAGYETYMPERYTATVISKATTEISIPRLFVPLLVSIYRLFASVSSSKSEGNAD